MNAVATTLTPGDLAALVGSRLCHDLISPLGAIGNGVELLQMADSYPGLAKSPELALIAEAVAAARVRIQAFRMAFGAAAAEQRISAADLSRHCAGMASTGRLTITVDNGGDAPRSEARMVLLALMCLETALPWGGRVLVCRTAYGWRLVAEAERTRPDPGLWAWLGGGGQPAGIAPAQVHFALLASAAATAARTITWDVDETGAEIAF